MLKKTTAYSAQKHTIKHIHVQCTYSATNKILLVC